MRKKMTKDDIRELFQDENPEALLADGFEDAFIGIARIFTRALACYDYEACLDTLVLRDKMTYEEAVEYFDFNVQGAYVGENTPVFLTRTESM